MFDVVLSLGGTETRWFVAWVEPVDQKHLGAITWPGTEGYYGFANDGGGNRYLIDPQQRDPEVLYYDHEAGTKRRVGVTLWQFLAAPRIYDEEDPPGAAD